MSTLVRACVRACVRAYVAYTLDVASDDSALVLETMTSHTRCRTWMTPYDLGSLKPRVFVWKLHSMIIALLGIVHVFKHWTIQKTRRNAQKRDLLVYISR